MKWTFLFITYSTLAFCDPIVFNTILNTSNCTHKIYHPTDKNIPHPYFSDSKIDKSSILSPVKAVGSASFLYHKETNELQYAIAYTNLSSPAVMIHLQIGYAHQDGPILATIQGKPYSKNAHFSHTERGKPDSVKMTSKERSGFLTGVVKLTSLSDPSSDKAPTKEEKMLVQGGCYITIHTYLNELGEIRGQLIPLSTKHIRK